MDAANARALCLQLPGASESIQWGDNHVMKVGGKMFLVSGPDADSRFSFKADPDRFLELTDQAGIIPAPYLARAKWVQVDPADCRLPASEVAALIRRSYELVVAKLPKKVQAAL